jgi:hypothetical protein
MNPANLAEIVELSREPEAESQFASWLEQCDVVPFLERDALDEDIVVYASLPHVYLHAILVPTFELHHDVIDRLLEWNIDAMGCWSVAGSLTEVSIASPLEHSHIPLVKAGEKIVFVRSFEGSKSKSTYYELNQKIAQVLGIHHLDERDAWCDLNRFGDIDEIVKIHRLPKLPGRQPGTVISMRRDRLGEFSAAAGYCLLRMFDFTRYRSGGFSNWGDDRISQPFGNSQNVFGHLGMCGSTGSYSRGVQVVHVAVPKERLLGRFWNHTDEELQYATFIACDWRHRTVGAFSCDPSKLANYFVPSELPYETTPAFFRPEVLSKYKADPEKYQIEHRTITCRGAWNLKGFGVNDAGQVHAYLCDLGDLPFEEQLHWRQFNEAPKEWLSASVIATDFEGQFSDEYDPLLSLKQRLDEVHQRQIGWWTLRDLDLPRRVQYPLTDTRADWSNELMNLDQLLVEGLNEKWLRAKAKNLGRVPADQLRALKLLEECLRGAGFDEEHARQILSPWHAVHNLRSELKGHASDSTARDRDVDARMKHGTLLNHFRRLCAECDESLQVIATAIEQ